MQNQRGRQAWEDLLKNKKEKKEKVLEDKPTRNNFNGKYTRKRKVDFEQDSEELMQDAEYHTIKTNKMTAIEFMAPVIFHNLCGYDGQ